MNARDLRWGPLHLACQVNNNLWRCLWIFTFLKLCFNEKKVVKTNRMPLKAQLLRVERSVKNGRQSSGGGKVNRKWPLTAPPPPTFPPPPLPRMSCPVCWLWSAQYRSSARGPTPLPPCHGSKGVCVYMCVCAKSVIWHVSLHTTRLNCCLW